MYKELPFFKFIPNDYLTGEIMFQEFAAQGLFTAICAIYWKKENNITIAELKRRYATAMPELWVSLEEAELIKIGENGQVFIKFLDEQRGELMEYSNQKSVAGAIGANKRWHTHDSAIAEDSNKDKDKDLNKSNKKIKSKEEKKKKYGEYKHVLLKDSEYEKVKNDFGNIKLLDLIKLLDEGIELKGYKYKNHNLAIRNWEKNYNNGSNKKDELNDKHSKLKIEIKRLTAYFHQCKNEGLSDAKLQDIRKEVKQAESEAYNLEKYL